MELTNLVGLGSCLVNEKFDLEQVNHFVALGFLKFHCVFVYSSLDIFCLNIFVVGKVVRIILLIRVKDSSLLLDPAD